MAASTWSISMASSNCAPAWMVIGAALPLACAATAVEMVLACVLAASRLVACLSCSSRRRRIALFLARSVSLVPSFASIASFSRFDLAPFMPCSYSVCDIFGLASSATTR